MNPCDIGHTEDLIGQVISLLRMCDCLLIIIVKKEQQQKKYEAKYCIVREKYTQPQKLHCTKTNLFHLLTKKLVSSHFETDPFPVAIRSEHSI